MRVVLWEDADVGSIRQSRQVVPMETLISTIFSDMGEFEEKVDWGSDRIITYESQP